MAVSAELRATQSGPGAIGQLLVSSAAVGATVRVAAVRVVGRAGAAADQLTGETAAGPLSGETPLPVLVGSGAAPEKRLPFQYAKKAAIRPAPPRHRAAALLIVEAAEVAVWEGCPVKAEEGIQAHQQGTKGVAAEEAVAVVAVALETAGSKGAEVVVVVGANLALPASGGSRK